MTMGTSADQINTRRRRPRGGEGDATFTSRIAATMTSTTSSSCTTNHPQKTRSRNKSLLPKSRLSRQPVPLNDPALICCSASTASSSFNDFSYATAEAESQKSLCSFTRQDVLDRLAVMQAQETTRPYLVRDYLNISSSCENYDDDDECSQDSTSAGKENEHKEHRMTGDISSNTTDDSSIPNHRPASPLSGAKTYKGSSHTSHAVKSRPKLKKRSSFSQPQPTDAICREKMGVWTFQVIDYCQLNRQTAELSIRMLDRLLSLASANDCPEQHLQLAQSCLDNRKTYQLAAMTCLYTSIKLNETQVMSPDIVASLSRGMATANQVVEMEHRILHALGWHICGPTGIDVVDHLTQLLPTTVPSHVKRVVIERSRHAIHQSLLDYHLSNAAPPTILGYAALVHTLDGLDEWTRTQYVDRDAIVTDLTLALFAQEGTIDEDLIVWSIGRISELIGDEDNGATSRKNKSRRPPTSSSSSIKKSSGPSLSSSNNNKRRESIDGTSPRTVVNEPSSAGVLVTP